MTEQEIEKKEIQQKIIEIPTSGIREEDFVSILKMVSPGTNLRTGLEGIVKAGKGALIVVENEFTDAILDGGFKINCRFTPQRLVELSKMDGAIILSKDMKRIIHANVVLTPDSKIPSNETGTRHKSGERTAKMTGTLVIVVSERKKEINLFYKNIRYHLRETSEVSRKTAETLQIMEKQRELFDKELDKLNYHELNGEIKLLQASKLIQRGKVIEKMLKVIEKNLIELGNEASSVKPRVKELIRGVEKETDYAIKDYTRLNLRKSKKLLETLSYDELIDTNNILTALANTEKNEPESIKGWRILSKTGLSDQDISELFKEAHTLKTILSKDKNNFKDILNEEKSMLMEKELERMKKEYLTRF